MNEHPAVSFRTKTGTCTITPEQVVLTRAGVRGAAADAIFGHSIGRALLIYGVVGSVALAYGVKEFLDGDSASGLLTGLMGACLLWNVVGSRNHSGAPVIARDAIRKVEAHPPNPPLTRGAFALHFEEKGRLKKRMIFLPGSMENGGEEYARAEVLLRRAGLLS